ncbi:PAS domain S-box protein [Planctomycetota bacterium]
MQKPSKPHNLPREVKETFSPSEDQYRTTLNSMRDAIHVVNSDLTILLMNDRFENWCAELGLEIGDPIGKNIFAVFPHLPRRLKNEYRQVFDSGQVLTTEEASEMHGRKVTTETRKIPVSNEDGQIVQVITVVRDITKRREAEQALSQSEEQYRSLVTNIPGVVWRSDQAGNTTFISQNIKEIYGYSQVEVYEGGSQLWFGRIHPDDVDAVKESFRMLLEEGMPLDVEYRIQRKDGAWIWLQDRSTGTYEKEGVKYADGVFVEVTARKQAEQTLQESEERFRVLSEASFEGVVFSDKGVLVDANKAFLNIYGYCYEEAIGKSVISFVAPEHRDMVKHKIQSGFAGTYDHKGIHKNGQVIDLEVHGRNVIHHGREMRMTAVRDITERKIADRKLAEYQCQLKSLTTKLTLAEEQEKRRVAEHLHDEVGQCLAFCKMKLQWVLDSMSERALADELETVCEMLTQSMMHVRNVTYDLSSPILKELGFEKAVSAWLKDDIERQHSVKTDLLVEGQTKPMDENLKSLLFRSIRELVTNAVKHANPNQIHVCINGQEENISVCVEDDGDGFNPETIEHNSKKGFGLFSIRERLDYLGGRLELISLPGHGCKATLKIPWNKLNNEPLQNHRYDTG